MNKVVPIAVIALLATLGLSAYAVAVYIPNLNNSNSSAGPMSTSGVGDPGTGTLNIYLTDSPHSNATLKYLLVNVTSVTLRFEGNESSSTSTTSSSSSSTTSSSTGSSSISTTTTSESTEQETRFVFQVPSSVGRNVNLTSLSGNSILLGATKVPAGNITGIILSITGARAFWTTGGSTVLKVVADGKLMIPVHFTVFANGTTNLTVDIVPGDIHTSQGEASILTPVVHVQAVSTGQNGTTQTTETSESETETTTSTTTTSTSPTTSSTIT